MRIAVLAGGTIPSPPWDYGSEVAPWLAARTLAAQGDTVEFFATGGSGWAPGIRLHYLPGGYGEVVPAYDRLAWDWYGDVLAACDIIHDWSHSAATVEALHLAGVAVPTLYTRNGIDFSRPRWGRERAVVLSEAARQCARTGTGAWADVDPPYREWNRDPGRLDDAAVVPYGVDLHWYTPGTSDPADYLLYIGRPHPSKGVDRILGLAAVRPDVSFVLAWRPTLPDHHRWAAVYARAAAQLPNVRIVILPLIGHQSAKRRWLQGARALIQPTRYVEAFGLTAIEALACGVPVLLGDKGSAPEIVRPGVTGFLLPPGDTRWNPDPWLEALDQVATLDRRACRADAEARWGVETMVDRYRILYALARKGETW